MKEGMEPVLSDEEIRDPWTHLAHAKARLVQLEEFAERMGDQLRDYAEAQARAMPNLVSFLNVSAIERLDTGERILTIRPEALDVRFTNQMLAVNHPENIAREIEVAVRRYADDLTRKVANVTNLKWFL